MHGNSEGLAPPRRPVEGVPRLRDQGVVGAAGVGAACPVVHLRVLYLFAGKRRRADIREHLEHMCHKLGYKLLMKEVDLELHGLADDLLDDKIWDNELASLANGDWDVLLGTPPCNTHTRVVWSNSRGPKPVRSRHHPRGFPWLRGHAPDTPARPRRATCWSTRRTSG
jgi:hypothetical protein